MQNIFGTDGIRGVANKFPMTPELMLNLGKAISLSFDSPPKVILGKDTRLSGYMIETALTSGLVSMGAEVLLVGPVPTPAIAHLTKSFAANVGIMITASHNPSEDNGIKLFNSLGLKFSFEEEEKIKKLISKPIESEGKSIGIAKRIDDARGRYIEFVKSSVSNISLTGLKIVLDCANGAAYHIAPDIFRELGAEVIVLNNKPNGININKDAGALYPEKVSSEVLGHYADIGFAFDGDADRVVVIDEKGNLVNGDQILWYCATNLPLKKSTIAVTDYSSKSLDLALSKKGISIIRTSAGDKEVMSALLAQNLEFGGEESGHLIFKEYATTGDGILSALKILSFMKGKGPFSEQIKEFIPSPQLILSGKVDKKTPFEKLPLFSRKLEEAKRELGTDGRIFVRYSGTEPKVRVLIEGKGNIEIIAKDLIKTIQKEVK